MTAKKATPEPVKINKEKKQYAYELRFTDIEKCRTQTRKFDNVYRAREWAIDKIGPEFKVNGTKHALSNSLMLSIILVKGPTPDTGMKELLVMELPPEPVRSSAFKVNSAKRDAIIQKLEEVLCFDPGTLEEDLRALVFATFHISLRKPKVNKKGGK